MKRRAVLLILATFLIMSCSGNKSTQIRQVDNFNADWTFYKGDIPEAAQPDFDDSQWRHLALPHDWSIEGPFSAEWASGTGFLPGGIGWYRKQFTVPEETQNHKVFIYFHGIYNNSEVWINGHYLGKRPNGYISFEYDLTPFVNFGGTNTLAVKVDHSAYADSRWYTGSGIYRDVELITTDKLHIKKWGVYAAASQVSAAQADLNIETTVVNEYENSQEFQVENILSHNNKLVDKTVTSLTLPAGADTTISQTMTVMNPNLWDVEHPNLYSLKTNVLSENRVVDDQITRTGFRNIRFDPNEGFSLNGVNLKLKGVCMHHDAGCLGAAVPLDVWERRLDIMKEMGANAIRTSHNAFSSDYLDLCDEKGFLVIDEVFDEWEEPKRKWVEGWNNGEPSYDGYADVFEEWHEQDLTDQVLRDRNHPSIIMWSIGNEIDYPNDPYTHPILNTEANPQTWATYDASLPPAERLGEVARELVGIVKKYDTTRPVTAGLASALMSNETGYADALDVVGYNYQEFRYPVDHATYPDRPSYGSENGMALDAWNAVADNDNIMGQFLWTGIEYMGEARRFPTRNSTSGTIDLAGNKKTEFYFRQSLWSDKPMLYIGTDRFREDSGRGGLWSHKRAEPQWNWEAGQKVRVKAFTNCESVELFLNNVSQGVRTLADFTDHILTWDIEYEPGTLKAVAKNNDVEKATAELRTVGEPVKIVLESDISTLQANNRDVAHVQARIVDENGTTVYDADNRITCAITGPARLLGIEDANARNTEDYKDDNQATYHGKALLYIQAAGNSGLAQITVSADGLPSETIAIKVKN